MQKIRKEISKEKFEKLQAMSYAEQETEIFPNGIPAEWEYGYGYYGHSVFEKDGKYYVQHNIGSSCE